MAGQTEAEMYHERIVTTIERIFAALDGLSGDDLNWKAPADATFNGVALFARTGIADILRTATRNPQLVGKEKIQGKDTLHLKGEVSGDKLNPLLGSTLKPDYMHPVDLWMEEQSSRPVQLHVSEPEGNGWLIDLFAPDEPVDIPTPKLPPPAPKPQD